MKLLQSHPDCLVDFNRYIDQRMHFLMLQIVQGATEMEQIHGFRYMLGELEAMKSIVNYGLVEQQQLNQLEGIDDGGTRPDGDDDWDDWC